MSLRFAIYTKVNCIIIIITLIEYILNIATYVVAVLIYCPWLGLRASHHCSYYNSYSVTVYNVCICADAVLKLKIPQARQFKVTYFIAINIIDVLAMVSLTFLYITTT